MNPFVWMWMAFVPALPMFRPVSAATSGKIGEPFLFCDINQKFSQGLGSIDSYTIASKNLGISETELIPTEGIGSSVYWWSDPEPYRASTTIHWDLCFTVFSTYQERDYIDYHKQLTLIDVKMGSLLLSNYHRDDLVCRSIDNNDSAICRAAPGKETYSHRLEAGQSPFIHNSSVPHSVTFYTPIVLRTVCFRNL